MLALLLNRTAARSDSKLIRIPGTLPHPRLAKTARVHARTAWPRPRPRPPRIFRHSFLCSSVSVDVISQDAPRQTITVQAHEGLNETFLFFARRVVTSSTTPVSHQNGTNSFF